MSSGGYTGLLCPACGQPIRGEISPDSIVKCESCQGSFVLRRRTSGPSSRSMPVASGVEAQEQGSAHTSGQTTVATPARGSNPRLSPIQGNVRPGSNPRLSPISGTPRPSSVSIPVATTRPGSNPRMTPVSGNPRPSSRRSPKSSGRMKAALPETAEVPATADGPDEEIGRETRSYSKQQIIAAAYDRPERVPLGPAPEPAQYKFLFAAAWGLLGVALLLAIWRFKVAEPIMLLWPNIGKSSADLALTSGIFFVSALLQSLQQILLAVIAIYAATCIARFDTRARWIAWRSASTEHSLESPPGSSLPLMIPAILGGALLTVGGLFAQVSTAAAAAVSLLGGGGIVTFAGLALILCGLGAGELRTFLWRVGQSGRALPMRKRGDEVGIVSPIRVQAFDSSNSAILILLSLAFVLAACVTLLAAGRANVKPAEVGPAIWLLAAGALIGIVGGAHALYKVAVLWNELEHGWELGARSIGKARVHFGQRTSHIFRWSAFAFCAATIALVIPVVKTIGGSSVPTMILSICLPAAAVLFFVWMAAVKMDSHHVVAASASVAGSRALEASTRPAGLVLAAILSGIAAAGFLWEMYVVYLQQQLISPSATGQMAVHLLESIMWAGISFLPACWGALMTLDLERAAANLETCREME